MQQIKKFVQKYASFTSKSKNIEGHLFPKKNICYFLKRKEKKLGWIIHNYKM